MELSNLNPTRFQDAYALGLAVFPVRSNDKVPAVPSWKFYKTNPASAEQVQEWDATDFNVGIITGHPSNIVVLDVDSDEAQARVDALDLPSTMTVKTGKGRHYYFRMPAAPIKNGTRIAGLELDVRGEGGYVVGAGSRHASGAMYVLESCPDNAAFADLPAAVLKLLGDRGTGTKQARRAHVGTVDSGGKFNAYLNEQLAETLAAIQAAVEGDRNATLFRASVKLAHDVAAAGAEWPAFADQLTDAALAIGLTQAEIGSTLASCWRYGLAEPTSWIATVPQWLYISKPDVFYHRMSGEMLKQSAFNNTFASLPVAKGNFARFLLTNDYIEVVHDLDYLPPSTQRIIERQGLTWYNTFRPSEVEGVTGDASPFIEFLEYLIPAPDERGHLTRMIAWTVRHPGKKLRHALLLRSRAQGVGKSMLTEIWAQLIGRSNVRKTTTEEIQGAYQGFIKETLLVILEELNWGFGPSGYNRLKDLITGDVASVNEKYLPVREWPNTATFVILTNLETPVVVEDRDRRLFYVDSPAEKRSPDYYRNFASWWNGNLAVIRGYLDGVDLHDFDPHAEPPMTAAKQALIADSRTELVRELAAAIEDRCGPFARDVVTFEEIEAALGGQYRVRSRTKLRDALRILGAELLGQQRVPRKMLGVPTTSDRISLWAIRNTRYWVRAGTSERAEEYLRQEGIFADMWGFEIRHASEMPKVTDETA